MSTTSYRGKTTFVGRFVLQALSGRRIGLHDAYQGVTAGVIDDWAEASLEVLISEGRSQLNASYAVVDSARRRGQYLIGMATALLGLGALRVEETIDNALFFATWSIGMAFAVVVLISAYALVCARAELGSIDTVLLSQEKGSNGLQLKKAVAEAYLEQTEKSVNTAAAWLTVLQSGIQLVVVSAVLILLSIGLPEYLAIYH